MPMLVLLGGAVVLLVVGALLAPAHHVRLARRGSRSSSPLGVDRRGRAAVVPGPRRRPALGRRQRRAHRRLRAVLHRGHRRRR